MFDQNIEKVVAGGDRLRHIGIEYINIPDPDLNSPDVSETDCSG